MALLSKAVRNRLARRGWLILPVAAEKAVGEREAATDTVSALAGMPGSKDSTTGMRSTLPIAVETHLTASTEALDAVNVAMRAKGEAARYTDAIIHPTELLQAIRVEEGWWDSADEKERAAVVTGLTRDWQ